MARINYALLLFIVVVAGKQEESGKSLSKTAKNDQEVSNDQVTSILVHPGPDGPRHVILSNDHQIISSSSPLVSPLEGVSGRAADSYNHPSAHHPSQAEFHQTIPPPLTQATYGPARPIQLTFRRARPQLYHHRGKIPHSKAPQEETVFKYSTYIKHDKVKELGKHPEKDYISNYEKPEYPSKGLQKISEKPYYAAQYEKPEYPSKEPQNSPVKAYYAQQYEKPDYSVTAESSSGRKPQNEGLGLSKYRTRDEEEEIKFRESIGDLYSTNSFEKSSEYVEKKQRPLVKQNYIPNVEYVPNKNYQSPYNSFDDGYYHDAPSGFDDHNGGKVVPILARFYKQPLPIIQTQLPADNVGLFIQYYPHHRAYENEEVSNGQYEYPKVNQKRDSSSSEWTPINAPDGAVPAKSYDIPAPDLSLRRPQQVEERQVYRRGADEAGVVVGKSKQKMATSSQHIQGNNSEGVVSAVVRVKQ